MGLTGRSIIGSRRGEAGGETLQALNPATGERLPPVYHAASEAEVGDAVRLADAAFSTFRRTTGLERARLLRGIAENIEALGETLVTRAVEETGLPAARIQGETARTCHQLRLFADTAEEGSWVDARIDRGDPHRRPAPRPDIRSMRRALGPAVVFGASNFPLAFSVAGGDTASALAAGNPVVVKAHPAHPGASELVGLAVRDAVRACGLHEGVFSLLYGAGHELGVALVEHPLIKAGGFTGSRAGGRALAAAAAARAEPIPFYAEMSSVNPVFILPGALRAGGEQLASGLHASVTLGAGQFCTNPGLILLSEDDHSEAFASRLGELMAQSAEFVMLTPQISSTYHEQVTSRAARARLKTVAPPRAVHEPGACQAGAALFQTDARTFLADPELGGEVFGPSTLLVTYAHHDELMEIARGLEGHLTATVHGTDEELAEHAELLSILETKVGRLVFGGFPTGVEVCHAMVHGGPYPATSDGRSTSVGTRAIFRFTRLVCYQNSPQALLPDELKDENPLGIWRLVDGRLTREPLS